MKRNIFVIVLLALLVTLAPLQSQEDARTAAAEREEAEGRYRTLTKRLEGIEESMAAFQKNVTALREEVRRVKDELDRSKNKNENAATQESIKFLAEKIEEVDKKRLNDNELVRKKLDELRKFMLEGTGGPRANPQAPQGGTPPKGGPNGTPKNIPDKQAGYAYKIKANDTLAGIVSALRKQGINVTQKQIEDANPGVNWNKLKIGQEIFIPQP